MTEPQPPEVPGPNASAVAFATITAEHLDDPHAGVLLAVLEQFRTELGMALYVANACAGLDTLLNLADRLAAEPWSLTAVGWAAFAETVRAQREAMQVDAALVADAEAFLASGDA